MRVFVTGASGFVGSAVVRDLLAAGHSVTGLARSEPSARAIEAAGARAVAGDLTDTAGLAAAAGDADAVIHTGFIHDFSRFRENCEVDRRAILAIGGALAGSDRPFVVTSGIGVAERAPLITEETPAAMDEAMPRAASEAAADAVAGSGVRVSVMRLPPTVHGVGDHGFVPMLVDLARRTGVSAYPEAGANRWPAVHRTDAARLYRLAIEAGATGRLNAVAEGGVRFGDIAAAIGRGLGLPVEARTGAAVAAHFGWFAHFAAFDVPASSAVTRSRLGWEPVGPTLMDDLAGPSYFAA